MRSLLTGGAGFIGSHLADRLLATGHDVLVLDDLSTGHAANLEGALASGRCELLETDISDGATLASACAAFRPDLVFHLAAQADVRRAVADPAFDGRVNVLGTINVLEAAREAGAPVIFAATGGAVYGEGEGRELPFTEASPAAPETPYGVSKLAGEHYVALYRRLHGLAGVALRFGNVYGPRQDPHGEAGVVAIFCGRVLAGERPRVFGDGLQTRDYVYVDDVVAAALAAARRLGEDPAALALAYNVGTGIETPVLDLVSGLGTIAGSAIEPEMAPARLGEVQRVAIDPAAAVRDLGWRPEVGIAEGLGRTLGWFREQARSTG